jgi:hypothetical protein
MMTFILFAISIFILAKQNLEFVQRVIPGAKLVKFPGQEVRLSQLLPNTRERAELAIGMLRVGTGK